MTSKQKVMGVFLTVIMVASVFAVPVAASNHLTVSASADDSSPAPGDTVTITYTVENTGSSDENGPFLNISDWPSDWTISAHSGDGTWGSNDQGFLYLSLGAGSSATSSVTFQVPSGSDTGDHTVSAEIQDGSGNVVNTVSSTISVTQDTATPTPGAGEEPDHDADLIQGGTYWAGQVLLRSQGVDANEELEVWSLTTQDGNLVKDQIVDQPIADSDGRVTINTADLDGRYLLEDSQDNPIAANWLVTTQTMTAGFADGTVSDEGSTELEFDSNRGRYTVSVEASGLSEDDLLGIFDAAGVGAEADDGAVALSIVGDPAIAADFTGVEVDDYNFTVTVTDTGVEDTASIDVVDAGEAGASFASPKTFQQERGDTLEFTVNLENTDSAEVVVGSTAVNYRVELTVTDAATGDDADSTVTVTMDTFRAGGWEGSSAADVFGTADSGDSVSATRTTAALSRPLSDGDYGLEVLVNGQQEDGGSIFLLQRSTDSMTLHTAPEGESFSDVDELLEVTSESDEVATGDWLVVQVQASGIYSYLEDTLNTGLNGITLTVEQTAASTRANADPIEVSLADAVGFADEENDQFFVAVPADWNGLEDGQAYDVTFTVTNPDGTESPVNDGANPLLADDTTESVSATADIVAGAISIDTNVEEDDSLVLPSDSAAEITGTSTYAAGTSVTVVVESGSSDNPYFERQTTTVSADGTWSTTFDTSDLPEGVEISVRAQRTGTTTDDSVDAEIGTPPTPEPAETVIVTRTVQVDSPTPRVVTEEVEVTRQVEVEVTRTVIKEVEVTQTPGQPGFGIAVAILALLAAAMLALRRRD